MSHSFVCVTELCQYVVYIRIYVEMSSTYVALIYIHYYILISILYCLPLFSCNSLSSFEINVSFIDMRFLMFFFLRILTLRGKCSQWTLLLFLSYLLHVPIEIIPSCSYINTYSNFRRLIISA